MRLSAFTLLVVILSQCNISNAQLNWVSYGSPNQVNVMCEDGNYIWVGTNFGLYKRHKSGALNATYTQDNSGLSNNTIKALALDFNNKLWIGTAYGLSCYNTITNTWETFTNANSGLPGNDITSLVVDGNGIKWIGVAPSYDLITETASGGGLVKYDNVNWTLYDNTNSAMTSNYITSIAIDGNEIKWIGTAAFWDDIGGGLVKYDNTNWMVYDTSNSAMPSNDITSVAIDGNGVKWIGTEIIWNYSGSGCVNCGGGLVKYDDVSWTVFDTSNSGLKSNGITSVSIDGNGYKWIGTHSMFNQNWEQVGGGIYKFDESTCVSFDTSNSGIPDNYILSIMIDGTGNKWIGTYIGLARYDNNIWSTYESNTGINHFDFNEIYTDSNNVWFATYNGLYKYDGITWKYYNTSNSGLPHNNVYDFALSQNGDMWIATENGLALFDGINWTVYDTTNSALPHNYITSLAFLNGDLWIGTDSKGLVKYDGTNWTLYNSTNSGFPNDCIYSITPDNTGNLWITSSFYVEGLIKFDGTNWVNYDTLNSGLPDNEISNVTIDPSGIKWISTLNGLASFDDFNWLVYDTTNSGLPSNTVFNLQIDTDGNRWIGTGNGLVKTDGTNWITYNTGNSGISNDFVLKIAFDSQLNIWLGTRDIYDNGSMSRARYEAPEIIFESDTACFPVDSTNFTNHSDKTDIFTQYKWDIGNDGTVEYTIENPFHHFTAAGTYPVKLTASNMTFSDSLVRNVTVGIIPDATITSSASVNLCQGNSIDLQAGDENYLPGLEYNYLWSEGSSSQNITVQTTGNYTVTISDYNCSSVSDPVNVNVQEAFNNEQICLVSIDTITWKNKIMVEKTPDVGTAGYEIYKEVATNIYDNIGFVLFDSSSYFIDLVSVPESHGDKYKISVVDTCGNESGMSFYHKTMNLVISSFGTTMGLSWTPYEDESGTFVPSKYYIYRGSEPNNMDVLDSVSGSFTSYNDNNVFNMYYYMIGVEKDIPCNTMLTRKSFSNKKQTPLGIEEMGYYGTILIAPNPMTSSTTLSIPNFESRNMSGRNPKSESSFSNFEIRISDLTGKVVRSEPLPTSLLPHGSSPDEPSHAQLTIDRGNLKPGIYFVELNAGRVYRGKLIVE